MASTDALHMARSLELAAGARTTAHPNPWVGAVIVHNGKHYEGATEAPGGRHAEAVALDAAPKDLTGATAYVTLEPCWPFEGKRTPSCAQALIDRGLSRVVIAMEDPDVGVRGRGIAALRRAGIEVEVGLLGTQAEELLAAYVHHRKTGRPYVVLKLAATLDGGTAAPDGTSQWITGTEARRDTHLLRAQSDAILVGAGTVRADNPSLDVRLVDGPDPRRIILGSAPGGAAVHPCTELSGSLDSVLDLLGTQNTVQLLVEGGATVAGAFHREGLVDRYVIYLAPALFGGGDARGLFTGSGASSIGDIWRGRILDLRKVGEDVRVDVGPR